jgi:hypothetical protein
MLIVEMTLVPPDANLRAYSKVYNGGKTRPRDCQSSVRNNAKIDKAITGRKRIMHRDARSIQRRLY